jgi:hypothetical protein
MIHRQDDFTVFKVAAQDLQRGNLRILSRHRLDGTCCAQRGTMLIYATQPVAGPGSLVISVRNGRVRAPPSLLKAKFENLLGPFTWLMRRYAVVVLNTVPGVH